MIITTSALHSAIHSAMREQVEAIVAEEADEAAKRVRERIMPAAEQIAVRFRKWVDMSESTQHIEISVIDKGTNKL